MGRCEDKPIPADVAVPDTRPRDEAWIRWLADNPSVATLGERALAKTAFMAGWDARKLTQYRGY